MLGAVGDLVEDVVVHLLESVNAASDTRSVVSRRRGGSAANVVEAACLERARARFIGQVGNDATGRWLTEQLEEVGADVAVRWMGRSGTIIVLVDPSGERTMLADRATCIELRDPDPIWLDGLLTLHIPYYSLVGEPLATTTATLARWANERGIRVSVDASSAALLQHDGAEQALARIAGLGPHVVLANELEAEVLGPGLHPDRLGGAVVVVKHGAQPAVVMQPGLAPVEVPALVVPGVRDTTGAGDAFAAGFLIAVADGADPVAAAVHGHEVAAAAVQRASVRAD
ncbi:MAG: carbohydrate kinase family protein [Actinobacteria bacterium]|nr:carbohydrate kinase family protein [Actinomycetota bacterium]